MMSKGCVNHRRRVGMPAPRKQRGYFVTNDSANFPFGTARSEPGGTR